MLTSPQKALRRTKIICALLAASCLVSPARVFAQVTPAGTTNTQVTTAPNGVPVVNIANPNSAGLSNNQYTNYNVDSKGLVLNNDTATQAMQVQSQLGGAVSANTNLTSEAKVILNQVVSTNRSTLAGYTEVVGGKADVVVANPNGITCDGCGFINIPNVMLTTGNPNIDPTTGVLQNFLVNKGDILITGQGLDASNTDYIGLFARSITVAGQINAKALDIIAGANSIDYATKAATAQTPTGTAPTLAIDSSLLGGMYADRIRLIATEAGVGVRLLGDAATGAGDFTLTSAGTIDVEDKISSKNNIAISSTASGTDAIRETDASLSASGDLSLTDTSGNIHLVGGALVAGGGLTLTSDTLTDQGDTNSMTNDNMRYATGNVTLSQSGDATLDDTSFGAGGALKVTTAALTVGADGETIYGGTVNITSTNDLALAGAVVNSTGNLVLTSTGGQITDSSASGQGIQSQNGTVTLEAANGLDNAGAISAATGGINALIGGTLSNSGTLYAKDAISIKDYSGNGTEDVTSSGKIVADGSLGITADTLTNENGADMQSGTGTNFNVTTLDNSGTLTAATNASDTGTINASSLTNAVTGILQSAGALVLNIKNTLVNEYKILSTGDLAINESNSTVTLTVNNNAAGIMQAGGTLHIKGAGGSDNVSIGTQNGGILANALDFNVSSLTNGGTIQGGGGASTVDVGGTLTNNANSLINLATSSSGTGTINATDLTNNGTIQSAGSLTANISNMLTDANNAKIIAGTDLTLGVYSLSMGGSGSALIAAQSGTGTGKYTFSTGLTNKGALFSGDDLTVSAPSIDNTSTGGIAATGNLTVTATGNGFTNYGALYGGTSLTAQAIGNWFTNEDAGTMDGGNISVLSYGFINNNNINASGDLTVNATYFYNEVTGGDQRAWSYGASTTTSTGWSSDPSGLLWGQSADDYYTRTWTNSQYYTAQATHKPQMEAGGTLSISNFQSGLNLGGIISGHTVDISTTQGGASFTNDDYSLTTLNYTETWSDHVSCCSKVIYLDYSGPNNDTTSHTTSQTSYGGGIYATNLNASGFSLTNAGSPYAANVNSTTNSDTLSGSTSTTSGAGTVTLGGLTITLPTNPNGYFIVSKDPNSHYLIETNPMYSVGSSFLGSDYMIKTYGLDPDAVERRLGDANYEGSLIKQQVLNDGAAAILGTGDQAAAMQQLMDNGVTEGKSLGLKLGVAPTAAQLANLKSNMVWMVDTVVDGQHVLAPVVYLSAATKSQITGGAVIAAANTNMNLTSLTNTGGTISGSDNLNITTSGNITNTSGTLSGGNVSLASTNGSIINQTLAQTSGGTGNEHTDIGKTASIGATGDLSMNAKNDITNKGANVSAGGNASLNAGNNITFTNIEDNESSQTHTHSGNAGLFGSGNSTDTTTTTGTNIGSNLSVGGNLTSKSGNDTTIQGSNVNVTGNGSVTAGGNINILDGQNTSDTSTSSTRSGAGVGGGLYGTTTTTDTDNKSTSVASNVNFGGNASLNAGGDLTLQGSHASAGGNMDVNATDVNVLAGRNTETHTTTTSTTTFGKIDTGTSSNSSGASAGAQADSGSNADQGGHAGADANAGAQASNTDQGGVTLSETNTTSTAHYMSNAAGSSLSSGGNMNINAKNDVNIVGSNVNAGGDANVNAKNVNVLAAQNIDTTTTTTSDTKTGLYGTSNNTAKANADANANAQQGGNGNPSANAGANASASANSDNTLALVQSDQSTDNVTDITHTGSGITSGGNMNINAQNDLNVNGSKLSAGGNADLNATNMSFTAATDSHTETKTDSNTAVGLYASAGANAQAGANAGAQGMIGSADASAGADANAGVGLYGTNTTSGSIQGSTTAQTSMISAGGNLTRNASNDITDQGTQINAGGNFSQSSKTWESNAAQNTTFSSNSSDTNTAKLGLYADANAGASAGASDLTGTNTSAGADASAGLEASYSGDKETNSATSSNAVVSNIHAGGNVTTNTSGAASLEGTNMSSGGDMTLNAGSLNYTAAHNTSTSSSSSRKIDADLKVGVDATHAVTGSVSGDYGQSSSSSSENDAVAGGMNAGGNLHVNTTGDANFEGTNLAAGGDAGINAGGNVNFTAAHNTKSSSSSGFDVGGSLSASKSKGGGKSSSSQGFSVNGSYNTSQSSENDAVTGSIKSGGNLSVASGKNATFEGTNLSSGGNTSVAAKGDVSFNAAQSTSSSSGFNVGGSIGGSKGSKSDTNKGTSEKSSGGSFSLNGGYNDSGSTTEAASNINSGGSVTVSSGHDVNLQGTNIASTGTTSLNAKHDVNFTATQNTSHSFGASGSIGGGTSTKVSTDSKSSSQAKTEKKNTGSVGFGVSGGNQTDENGGSITAGNISINSGNDTTLVGTKTHSAGDTTVNAGGQVNLEAAHSSGFSGGIGGGASVTKSSESQANNPNLPNGNKSSTKGMGGLSQLGISGNSSDQGVDMSSGGNLTINSGGKTTMQGSKLSADGNASVNAKGGIEKKTTVGVHGKLGLSEAGAGVSIQTSQIISKNIAKSPEAAKLAKSFTTIENNPNLTRAQKFTAMADQIKNDASLTKAEKSNMLAALDKQEKTLDATDTSN